MLNLGPKSVLTFLAVFTLCNCIDPYNPKFAGYESLLVVEGLVTDANASYTVKLSRTFQEQSSVSVNVSDATVFISDDSGNKSYLKNKNNGIYKTDSLEFKGTIGKTYILHIRTNEGEEYESDPCLMQSVPDIDSIYFEKDQQLINNGNQTQDGLSIFLDSKQGDNNQYYRWAFDETWKFKVPDPKKYDFNVADSTIVPATDVKEYCWKNKKSDGVIIHAIYPGEPTRIVKEPIFFIATDQSDRLLIQYSILVSQYSISKKDYDFWNDLKQVNDNIGGIFAKQPFTVTSNIKDVNNPEVRVLGYFQVSAVKQKRKDIPFSAIVGLNLPYYHYPCVRIEKEPADFQTPFAPPVTWFDVYSWYCITSTYSFVEPKYISGTNKLEKMVFVMPECANCELTGTRNKPDFWVDLN
jgi:hypothetical protein